MFLKMSQDFLEIACNSLGERFPAFGRSRSITYLESFSDMALSDLRRSRINMPRPGIAPGTRFKAASILRPQNTVAKRSHPLLSHPLFSYPLLSQVAVP